MPFKKMFSPRLKVSKHELITNEVWSAITHGVGFFLAIVGLVLLIIRAVQLHSTIRLVTFSIYGACLCLLYLFSTLYHSLIFTPARRVFQIFDHSAIFILIAGSYTPYTLVSIGGTQGWILFGIVWALAIFGIVFRILSHRPHQWVETLLYIGMGWLIIFSARPLAASIGIHGLWLLISGGIAYTGGALLYSMRHIKYIHVIWHLFVMLGSALIFFSILWYV